MRKPFIAVLIAVLLFSAGCGRGKRKQSTEGGEPLHTEQRAVPRKFEMVQVPVYISDQAAMVDYMATHFWDLFDFTDAGWIDSGQAEGALVNYLMVLDQLPGPQQARARISDMMSKAAVNSDMFNYLAGLYEHYLYDPNSPYRSEELYMAVLESVIANPALEDIEKLRSRSQLNMVMKNRVGSKAADFGYSTAKGGSGTLYGISADYLLLFFYNLGCPACKEMREGLLRAMNGPLLSPMVSSGRLKVLAVYPDKDMTEWDKYVGDIPSDWINAYDPSQAINDEELYDLRAIPSLYLLDREKRVMLKDFVDIGELEIAIGRSEGLM